MQKFRCEKCGHRIAIQPRHLGSLVACPECGNLTHPLAERIIERGPAAAAAAPPPTIATSREPSPLCENCGRTIGRLEARELWGESIVCPACHRALSDAKPLTILTSEGEGRQYQDRTLTSSAAPRKSSGNVVRVKRDPCPATVPRLSLRVPRGPLRVILWLIVLALAAWFVLNVVRFISVLVNVAIVGFLLLAALWVLYQSGMNELDARAGPARDESDFEK